jgi:quercetin dioxygenase-like cupin family protein
MDGVDISHHWVEEEVYHKRTRIKAGHKLVQHVHPWDHASALVSGTVLLEVDGERREITGPDMLLICAGKEHSVTALTDVVWHCIHITDDTDPETVDQSILTP